MRESKSFNLTKPSEELLIEIDLEPQIIDEAFRTDREET